MDFLKRNSSIIVNGLIQNKENGRKKIEIKREIREMFPLLKERCSEIAYFMEFHAEDEMFLKRVKEIKEKSGNLPILLVFCKKE